MKPRLLIVDDDEDIRTQMRWALAEDYDVALAENRGAAVKAVSAEGPDVVLLDLGLPPRPADPDEGFLALGEILAVNPRAKVVIITGQGEKTNALKAIGEGAYDFLAKPVETEELKVILRRAFHISQLEREYHEIQSRLGDTGFEGMIGTSPQMEKIFADIRKVSTTEVPVLILGESGTGKELAALAIHRNSSRRDGAFIAINCTAIPEALLESELFGHEKGAFTGAHVQRKGRIESANGGTLFLDEIGELPPALQVKLLRFLQEQRIERIGGREQIEVDARIVAATNADLKKAMKENQFREDLYFRLAVVTLQMPPLRERAGDIPVVARALLTRYVSENGKDISAFSQKAKKTLEAYGWPGNIREMQNRIKRAVIMAEGRQITPEDMELTPADTGYQGISLKDAREQVEREMIEGALARNKGNVSRTADDLGVSRPTLYELLDKLGIARE